MYGTDRRYGAGAGRLCFALVAGMLAIGCAGCGGPAIVGEHRRTAMSSLQSDIPLGEWAGEGIFVCEIWGDSSAGGEPVATQPVSNHRRYPTRFSLRERDRDGRPTIEMEVRSENGGLTTDEAGAETHFVVALMEPKRVGDSASVYRLAGPSEWPEREPKPRSDVPYAATCMTHEGITYLQIHYLDRFVDTLRFSGNTVEKSGMILTPKEGLVHWVERLERVK